MLWVVLRFRIRFVTADLDVVVTFVVTSVITKVIFRCVPRPQYAAPVHCGYEIMCIDHGHKMRFGFVWYVLVAAEGGRKEWVCKRTHNKDM